MGWTLIANTGHVTANNPVGTDTTAPINTTGANLLVLFAASYFAMPTSISDSKGNTWTLISSLNVGGAGPNLAMYYSIPTSVGSGHTFSCSGTFNCTYVSAWSGSAASPLDKSSSGSRSGTTVQPGSITPAVNGELIVFGACTTTGAPSFTCDSGFTLLDQVIAPGGVPTGCSLADFYLIQTSAAAINPTATAGASGLNTGVIASFKVGLSYAPVALPLMGCQ